MSGNELWHQRLGQFEQHMKCPSCMVGNGTLEDRALNQMKKDSFSFSVTSIEGFNYAAVSADCNSGYIIYCYYIRVYGRMLKREIYQRWSRNGTVILRISDKRTKYYLKIVLEQDSARERISHEIIDFFGSMAVKNYLSTAHEQG